MSKVIIPAGLSPIIAALVAATGTWLLYRISRSLTERARGHGFRIGQIGSASMVSLAHGTNDAQKTMGVITLALIVNGTLPQNATAPFWVILSCALAISIGTYLGGWRVIRTLGKGLVEIAAPQGMAAESASAAVILLSSSFGYSLSTTHVATGSIIGTGLRQEGRRCPLEHRRADGHGLGAHPAGRRADGCRGRIPGARDRPHAGRDCRPAHPGRGGGDGLLEVPREQGRPQQRQRGVERISRSGQIRARGSGLSDREQTMSWINLAAIWKIVVFGLLAGAGLPAIFALGMLALSKGGRTQTAGAGGADSDVVVGGNPAGIVVAAFCFLIVLAAIGWGIYEIYKIGHPAPAK